VRPLPVLVLLLLAAMLAGWLLLQGQSPAEDPSTSSVPDSREKQLIDQARKNKDIAALNDFIRKHPDSEWLDTALFYRDQFAYREAMAKGDRNSLERYLKEHPDSQWTGFVQQQLEQIQREEDALKARQERERLLKGKNLAGKLPIQPAAEESSAETAESPAQALVEPPSAPSPLSARERIQRALSIYEKQRAEKEFSEYQQQQREQETRSIRKAIPLVPHRRAGRKDLPERERNCAEKAGNRNLPEAELPLKPRGPGSGLTAIRCPGRNMQTRSLVV